MVQIEGTANLVKQFEVDFKVVIERAPSARNWSKGLFCTAHRHCFGIKGYAGFT